VVPTTIAAMTALELFYFDIAGKGEPIRLACAYAGLPLKDTRLSREEFTAMKESGELKYGQVPALKVGGNTVINQSASIMRYLGRVATPDVLYPQDPLAAAFVDSIVDQEVDLFAGLSVSRYTTRFGFSILNDESEGGGELKMKVRKELNDEVLPRHLANFEKLMANSSTGWIGNTTHPSIADFILVPRLQWLMDHGEGISERILAPYPKLVAMMERLMNLDAVTAYYKEQATRNRNREA
jgi:glutathione S-transferase